VSTWAVELANDAHKHEIARRVIEPLAEEDIATWGYDKAKLFDKIAEVGGQKPKKDKKWALNSYRLKRKLFMALRKDIHEKPLGRMLKKMKYYCDVLLRE
jgi:hypothetical protein